MKSNTRLVPSPFHTAGQSGIEDNRIGRMIFPEHFNRAQARALAKLLPPHFILHIEFRPDLRRCTVTMLCDEFDSIHEYIAPPLYVAEFAQQVVNGVPLISFVRFQRVTEPANEERLDVGISSFPRLPARTLPD